MIMVRNVMALLALTGAIGASPAAPHPMPARATASPAASTETAFLALSDLLIDNIGTADTIILFYVAVEGDPAGGGCRFGVRYLVPGAKMVRIQSDELNPIVLRLVEPADAAIAADPAWRSATLVIDHGRPSLTMRRADTFEANKPFGDRMTDESTRVFPGIPVVPYRPSGPTT